MDTSESWKYERDYKQLRKKQLGEILQMKFEGTPFWKTLAEMELQRRAFVRDVLADRILAILAIVISLLALFLPPLLARIYKAPTSPPAALSQP